MQLALPARRPLAILVALAVLVTGLALSPFAATAAHASNASDASAVLARVNAARTGAPDKPAFLRNGLLKNRAQEYAALYAAAGSVTKPLTKSPATALPGDPAVNGSPTEELRVFKVSGTTAKARTDKASAQFIADGLPASTDSNYASVGYVTKGSYSYAVLLVVPYTVAPIEYRSAATPAIVGKAAVGSTLTLSGVKFVPAVDASDVIVSWSINGETVSTTPTYFVTAADLGTTITATVAATTEGYATSSATSKATARITKGTLKLTTVKTQGPRAVGSALSADFGFDWTPNLEVTLQWYRGSSKITGETNYYYQQTSSDYGKKISVKVSGSAPGYASIARQSSTKIVTGYKQIENPGDITVTGNLVYGQTLTATSTPWSNVVDDEPTATATAAIKLAYQWYSNGRAIAGATKSTLKLPASVVGEYISVRVTGTQAKRSATATWGYSEEMAVQPLQFENAGQVAVSGTFAKGKTVTAKVTGTTPSASYSYQWYNGESKITGATKSTYVLTSTSISAGFVQVMVTVKKSGYDSRVIWGGIGLG